MDELQHELEVTRMDLHQVSQENKRLKESENNLRDHLYDQDNDLSRLERELEKAQEEMDLMRSKIRKLQQQRLVDARKIIQLHEEIKVLHKPYLHLPAAAVPTAQAPPAFADDDELIML